MTICRECHREGEHLLSCSHVRYEGRLVVEPTDEVAPDREPSQPYCPGPEVACYFGPPDADIDGLCRHTLSTCYYHHEE